MKRRQFLCQTALTGLGLALAPQLLAHETQPISVGIIGLDTSHSTAFTKILNDPEAAADVAGFRVTHAYPQGSLDIESSISRIPRYTQEMREMGVEIVDSLEALLEKVELVLLETNDGRRHLEQARAVFSADKPVFIDKPVAASFVDALAIYQSAKQYKVPVFSASSLRFSPTTVEVASGNKIGKILGAETYSPATLEPTHTDLFWYGIHGVEALFTLMGPGCRQVRRFYRQEVDVVVGEWEDGRIGTFRGVREGKTGYGGRAYGTEGIAEAGGYEGYRPLVVEIVRFFQTGVPPVSAEETLEIFAFMEAAEISKRKNGKPIRLDKVWK
jgi:predicted dehydrogenase